MAVPYEGRIDHTEDSIQALFQTQYNTYRFGRVLLTAAAGVALVAVGLFAPMPLWGQALTTLAGCLLFVGRDFPAIVRSVKAVDARGGVLPTTVCVFGSGQMELQEGGIHKKLNYRKVDRLVQDKKYLYLFLGPDSVIMVDRGKIENGCDEDVMQLVEKRTGKKWEEPFSLLTVNLHDLLRLWDRRKAAKQKEK